jgi:hypothetical protein
LPELNLKLRPTLLKMKPGTRIVSHSFLMDDWEPDERSMTDDGSAYLWIVPARVDGTWTFAPAEGGERFIVQLEQTFQRVTGTIGSGANAKAMNSATLSGTQLELNFIGERGTSRLQGTVNGARIEAVVIDSNDRQTRYVGTRS